MVRNGEGEGNLAFPPPKKGLGKSKMVSYEVCMGERKDNPVIDQKSGR